MGSFSLQGKRILLIVGGGIAAYKTLELIRRLKERGAHVRAVLTKAGERFVTPLSLASLTGEKVYADLFSLTDEAEMGHIELSRSADLLVVAPATADLMAKMAGGLANDLASTLLLATDKRVLLAPAMNVRMWQHPATRRNAEVLTADGVLMVGPGEGEMACGEYGPGRMAEPLEILAAIEAALQASLVPLLQASQNAGLLSALPLAGKKALVTAGPTHEPIDPVRFIANRSSGRQGYAIAEALAALGAKVTLVSGPVSLMPPIGIETVQVKTACEMLEAVEKALPVEIAVFAAAVADWRVSGDTTQKIKKAKTARTFSSESLPRTGSGVGTGSREAYKMPFVLVENPDILATVARRKEKRPSLVIGFAAETDNVLDHAREKFARKGCDLLVANDVSAQGSAMGGERNRVHLVTAEGIESWDEMSKIEVARKLAERAAQLLQQKAAR